MCLVDALPCVAESHVAEWERCTTPGSGFNGVEIPESLNGVSLVLVTSEFS